MSASTYVADDEPASQRACEAIVSGPAQSPGLQVRR
jgi:hypothetical protein